MGRPIEYTEEVAEEICPLFPLEFRYKTEKEMVDILESQIADFAYVIYPSGKYLSHAREYGAKTNNQWKGCHGTKIDLVLFYKDCTIAVEAKNPRNAYLQTREGISQCMDYLLKRDIDKCILVSSVYSDIAHRLINGYNLEIGYALINKNHTAILRGWDDR